MVMAALCLIFIVNAQQKTDLYKAVGTGEKLPEKVWNLPLQITNDPGGNKSASLNDYKGKLILIDFWSTWCKGCLESFPHSVNLQMQFSDQVKILYVTSQHDSTISAFFKTHPNFAKLGIVSVTSDSLFNQLFPHRIYPHVVWIGKNGNLLWQTSASEVTEKNVKSLLANEQTTFQTVKKDILNIDFKQPLFYSGSQLEGKILFRSTLSPYIPGLPSRSGIVRNDSTIRFYATNVNAVYLYKKALQLSDYQWPQNRIVFEGSTRKAFEVSDPTEYPSKTYCYELIIPLAKQDQLFETIASELNSFFRIKADIERQSTKCYVLDIVKTGLLPVATSALSGQNLKDDDGKNKFINNEWLSTLTNHLNTIKDMPFVLELTGIKYKVDLKLNGDFSDIKSLNAALAKYGLTLKPQIYSIEMLVFSPITNTLQSTETN